jgi:tRNA threonylcarbamoyladenosine biosynthesis protein TsaE
MNELIFEAADERDTDRLGAALAAALPPGTTVALYGTLGAGKTRLVQAIAAACGVPREEVVSPTFVLCQEYHGTRTIYHLDFYRLRDADELRELGVEELLDADALVLIEWADRVAGVLPDERLEIEIEVTGPTSRRLIVRAVGSAAEEALGALSQAGAFLKLEH